MRASLQPEKGFPMASYDASLSAKYERLKGIPGDFPRFMEDDIRIHVDRELKRLGFSYVALDIAGYRSGSMNATLPE